jgi:hypothetical protein
MSISSCTQQLLLYYYYFRWANTIAFRTFCFSATGHHGSCGGAELVLAKTNATIVAGFYTWETYGCRMQITNQTAAVEGVARRMLGVADDGHEPNIPLDCTGF